MLTQFTDTNMHLSCDDDFNPISIDVHLHEREFSLFNTSFGDEIIYQYPNLNGSTVEVRNWISNFKQTLSGMWLIIHAGIELNPC